jgi:hypothetical protein
VNTKIIFSLVFLGFFGSSMVQGQAATGAQGVVLYSESPGVAPKVYVCRKIEPVDGFLMPVELENGVKLSMDIRSVYALVDYNKLGSAEINDVKEFKKLEEDLAKLEKTGKDFPVLADWVKPKVKELRSEAALYEKGNRKQGGHWMTPEEIKTREQQAKAKEDLAKLKAMAGSATGSLGSLTTKQGKTYADFEVTKVDESSVVIRHASGIARIAYRDMPDDLAVFPDAVRQEIRQKKEAWEAAQGVSSPGGP